MKILGIFSLLFALVLAFLAGHSLAHQNAEMLINAGCGAVGAALFGILLVIGE